jgi:hypothetical protein
MDKAVIRVAADMPGREDNGSRSPSRLGRVEAGLDYLIDEFHRERDRSEHHRQNILDGIGVLNASVKALITEVEAIKPTVADFKEMRAENRGMARVGRWLWAIVTVVAGLFATCYGAIYVATHSGGGATTPH